MRLKIYGATVIGPRHQELKEPNQDCITIQGFCGGWIAAVADGLGSNRYSHIGSKHACQVAANILRQSDDSRHMDDLLRAIHVEWKNKISPLYPHDASTTLLFVKINRDGRFRVAQLGDGLLLIRSNGQFSRLTPTRKGYGNQTEALGTEFKLKDWLWADGYLSKKNDAIVLMTDGISDDLDYEYLSEFVTALEQDLQHRNRRTGRRWLQRELEEWSTPMHSDDKSLIAIFRN